MEYVNIAFHHNSLPGEAVCFETAVAFAGECGLDNYGHHEIELGDRDSFDGVVPGVVEGALDREVLAHGCG